MILKKPIVSNILRELPKTIGFARSLGKRYSIVYAKNRIPKRRGKAVSVCRNCGPRISGKTLKGTPSLQCHRTIDLVLFEVRVLSGFETLYEQTLISGCSWNTRKTSGRTGYQRSTRQVVESSHERPSSSIDTANDVLERTITLLDLGHKIFFWLCLIKCHPSRDLRSQTIFQVSSEFYERRS